MLGNMRIVERLHPSGTTSRRSYREALLGFLALFGWLIVWTQADLISDSVAIALIVPAFAALFLLTIRRLRDAGLSAYWAALMLFPAEISIGTFGVRDLLASVPILLALLARERRSPLPALSFEGEREFGGAS